ASGPDSFQWRISDGKGGTAIGTASVSIDAVNQPPVTQDLTLTTAQDRPVTATIVASDPDGDTLSFQIVEAPTQGRLGGSMPTVVYSPNSNATGSDRFRWRVSDGRGGTATG